jgi:hypothetical protein
LFQTFPQNLRACFDHKLSTRSENRQGKPIP